MGSFLFLFWVFKTQRKGDKGFTAEGRTALVRSTTPEKGIVTRDLGVRYMCRCLPDLSLSLAYFYEPVAAEQQAGDWFYLRFLWGDSFPRKGGTLLIWFRALLIWFQLSKRDIQYAGVCPCAPSCSLPLETGGRLSLLPVPVSPPSTTLPLAACLLAAYRNRPASRHPLKTPIRAFSPCGV